MSSNTFQYESSEKRFFSDGSVCCSAATSCWVIPLGENNTDRKLSITDASGEPNSEYTLDDSARSYWPSAHRSGNRDLELFKAQNSRLIENLEKGLNSLNIDDCELTSHDRDSDIKYFSDITFSEDDVEMTSDQWDQDGIDADISEDCEEDDPESSFRTPERTLRRSQLDLTKFRIVQGRGNLDDESPVSKCNSPSSPTLGLNFLPIAVDEQSPTASNAIAASDKHNDDDCDADISDGVSEIEQSRPETMDDSDDTEVYFGPITLREKLIHEYVRSIREKEKSESRFWKKNSRNTKQSKYRRDYQQTGHRRSSSAF